MQKIALDAGLCKTFFYVLACRPPWLTYSSGSGAMGVEIGDRTFVTRTRIEP